MDPASGVVQELTTHGVEWQALTPGGRLGSFVDAFDESRQHAGVSIGGTGCEEHGIGVPSYSGNGGANRLLDVLGHPPVVFLLEVADWDEAGARPNGELGLGWRPTDAGSGAVDT